MTKPDFSTLPEFHKRYVQHVKDYDLLEAMKISSKETLSLVRSLPEEKGEYRYAAGKWSIKEVLCHMIDTERILAYRALRFAKQICLGSKRTIMPPRQMQKTGTLGRSPTKWRG